jgi:hypothetical protein
MLNKIKRNVIIGAVVLGGAFGIYKANQPLEYDFSSVYDGSKHHVLIYADGSKRYAIKCAEELADHLIKAKLGSFDINIVKDGEYTLVFYNGSKVK